MNLSKAAVAGPSLDFFSKGTFGATLSSSLDGISTGASSGVTAAGRAAGAAAELRLGSAIASEEEVVGRNNESVQDVLSSSQQQ